MNSRSLIDPELLPILDMFTTGPLNREALPALRQTMAEMSVPATEPASEGVSVEEVQIPSHNEAHSIRALVYRPTAVTAAMPGVLEIHGGGYVVGMPEMSDAQNRQLSASLGCVVVAVDYRLAPETPHPGPVEDCYSALKWFYDSAHSLNVDRNRLGITGGSAGGGLAAALALLARDRGVIPIAFQALVMPMLDDRTVTRYEADPHPYAGEFIWTLDKDRFGWQSLLDCEPGADGVSPYAAPARAENLAGLPPTFISTGALDLFVEEDMEYARRLIRAGVPTELHVYPGAIHGFAMVPSANSAQMHSQALINAMGRALAASGP